MFDDISILLVWVGDCMKLLAGTSVGGTNILDEFADLWDYVKRIEVGVGEDLSDVIEQIMEELKKKQDKLLYVPENVENKGVANGYAPLGSDTIIPIRYLPSLDYIPMSEKGNAYGVATLNASGKLETMQVPTSLKAMKIVSNIWERDYLELGNKLGCNYVVDNLYSRDNLVINGTISVGEKVHVESASADPYVDDGWGEYLYLGNSEWRLIGKHEVHEGFRVHVIDASADTTVNEGWAEYLYIVKSIDGMNWTKVGENESLDVIIDYDKIQNSPWLSTKDGNLYYTGLGNVGVGTKTPIEKMDIEGGIRIFSDSSPARIVLYGDTSNIGDSGELDTQIQFLHDNGNTGYHMNVYNNSDTSDFELLEKSYDVYKSRLFLKGREGSLGIGLSNPKTMLNQEKLYVQLDNADQYVYIKNTDSTSNNLPVFKIDGRVGKITPHMIVTRAGNVGINVLTPSESLEIDGRFKMGSTILSSESVVLNGVSGVGIQCRSGVSYVNTSFIVGVGTYMTTSGEKYIFDKGIYSSNGHFGTHGKSDLDFSINGESVIFIDKDTHNVGIGVSNPAYALDVLGDFKTSGAFYSSALGVAVESSDVLTERKLLFDGSNGVDSPKFWISHNTNLGVDNHLRHYVVFDNSFEGGVNSNYSFMNGHLGINTLNPRYNLDVEGDIGISGGITFNDSCYMGVNGDYVEVRVDNYSYRVRTEEKTLIEFTSDNKVFFDSNRIGFGVRDIVGNIDLGSGSGSKFAFGGLSDDKLHRNIEIYYQDGGWSGSTLFFREYGQNGLVRSDLLTLNNSKVGVGATSPVSKFHVAGFDVIGMVDKFVTTVIDDRTSRLQLRSNGDGVVGSSVILSNDNKNWVLRSGTNSDNNKLHLGFRDTSGVSGYDDISLNMTKLVTMTTNGDLGIGTESPEFKLDVKGNSRFSGEVFFERSFTFSNYEVNSNSNNIQFVKGRGVSGTSLVKGDNLFSIDGSAVLRGGNLQLVTQIKSLVESVSDSNVSSSIVIRTRNSSGVLGDKLVVSGDGNVGIGVSGPSSKLEVNGDLKIGSVDTTRLVSDSSGLWSIGNGCIVLGKGYDDDSSVRFTYEPGTLGGGSGVLKIGQLSKNNLNFTHGITSFYVDGVEKLRLDRGGNLGVGTSSPTHRLHVMGKGYFGGNLGINDSANSYGINVLGGGFINTQSNVKPFVVGRDNNELGSISIGVSGDVTYINQLNDSDSSKVIFNLTNLDSVSGNNVISNVDVLTLYSRGNRGFVGIGKSNPVSELDIVGNIRLSGDIVLPNERLSLDLKRDDGSGLNLRMGGLFVGKGLGSVRDNELYVSSKIGIGIIPEFAFDVVGDIRFSGQLINDYTYFGISKSDGSKQIVKSGGLVVSDDYNDSVDLTNGYIKGKLGIGVSNPIEKLSVNGNISLGSYLKFSNGVTLTNSGVNSLVMGLGSLGYVFSESMISSLNTISDFSLSSSKRVILNGVDGFGTNNLFISDNKLWLKGSKSLDGFNIQIGDSVTNKGSFKILGSLGEKLFEVSSNGTLSNVNIGDVSTLTTTSKVLVGGINELNTKKYDKSGGLIRGDIQLVDKTSGGVVTTLKGYGDAGNFWVINSGISGNKSSLLLASNHNYDTSISLDYESGVVGSGSGILKLGQLGKNHANFTHGVTALYTSGKEQMRIASNGFVGIGTNNPNARLHVVGDLIVEGDIIEKSIKFTPTTIGWYRIMIKEGHQSGMVRLFADYDNKKSDVEFHYSISSFGNGGSIQQLRHSSYNGGIITKVRVSEDYDKTSNLSNMTYLDIYIDSCVVPGTIYVYSFGMGMGDRIESPVVGAITKPYGNVYELVLGHGYRTTNSVVGSSGLFSGLMDVDSLMVHKDISTSVDSKIRFGGGDTYLSYDSGKVMSSRSFRVNGNTYLASDSGTLYFGDSSDNSIGRINANYLKSNKGIIVGTNLGVGVDSPVSRIHVRGSVVSGWNRDIFATQVIEDSESRLQIVSNNEGQMGSSLILTTGSKSWSINANALTRSNTFSIGYYESSLAGQDIALNSSQILNITTNGRVGFKTTNPSYDVDVNGVLNATDIKVNGESLIQARHKHTAKLTRAIIVVDNLGISSGSVVVLPGGFVYDSKNHNLRVVRDGIEQILDSDSTSCDFDYWEVDNSHIRFNYNIPEGSIIKLQLIEIIPYEDILV